MNIKFFPIIGLCLFVGTACADSQYQLYKQLDANKDGYIGPAEGAELEGVTENWELLDINRDGQLDRKEFTRLEVLGPEHRDKRTN